MASKLFADERVWITPTEKIRTLDKKVALFIKGQSQWEMNLKIENADPNSPERGKVAVIAWQSAISHLDEPWDKIEIFPTKAPTHAESHLLQRFPTQAALDSMRSRSSETPEYIDFELVIPDTPEYAGH
jgi:hypothetical protein